jgi:uncharacterized damage-inducible protein DinB
MAHIVADLLEALLQIKALAETPARVARLLESTDARLWAARRGPAERAPVEILAHLADAEEVFLQSIRLVLDGERPSIPAIRRGEPGTPSRSAERAPALESNRFGMRRRETVDLLSSCSAAQLERIGVHPIRKLVNVADIVAIMLAHDTDHLGQMTQRLGTPRCPESSPSGR